MLLNYDDCLSKYGLDYQIKKHIKDGLLFKIQKGLYSDSKYISEKQIIAFKYPNAVYTGEYAYYFYGLTDTIPDKYTLATKRNETRMKEKFIKQSYVLDKLYDIGITTINSDGVDIKIYDQERMLIELIRFASKYSFDYYKEIIRNYRERIYKMDFVKLQDYASKFDNYQTIMDVIQKQVL